MKITVEQTDKKVTIELSDGLTDSQLLDEMVCLILAMGYTEKSVHEAVIELAQELEDYQELKQTKKDESTTNKI